MDEREPTKSNALESSLWEIVTLQKHALPSIATAAKFISQPLPSAEWDLSSVLEIKEDDVSFYSFMLDLLLDAIFCRSSIKK